MKGRDHGKAIVLKKQSVMITNSKKFQQNVYESPSRDKRNLDNERRYAQTEMRDSNQSEDGKSNSSNPRVVPTLQKKSTLTGSHTTTKKNWGNGS